MAGQWSTVDRAASEDGLLELREHESGAFLMTLGGRVLMDSHANRSETALAELACKSLSQHRNPLMLTAGLGMGCTLRAALYGLPPQARIVVCEINEVIVDWCRGPLASINERALDDPRVLVHRGDVAEYIAGWGRDSTTPRFDGVILDLHEGPHAHRSAAADVFYGDQALARTRTAMSPGGVLAVWAEAPDPSFERRLRQAGFSVELSRHGRGGRRHAVYVASLSDNGATRARPAAD